MGLWSKLTGEFIDIIEFLDETNDTLAHRFERYQNEIKNGAQLIVRESQIAVFVNEGKFADVFQPGTHRLTTQNLPILSTLKGWKYGFDSPFKVEVYFINTRVFHNLKWGTPQPIPMRDADFGIVQMRAHGGYHFRVEDPQKLITEAAGTDGHFTVEEIEKRLRDYIQTGFPDAIGESKIPLLDLLANYNELSALMVERLKEKFAKNGLNLIEFTIGAITVPDDVQKAINDRSSMGILGNLNEYQKFKAGQAMEEAAKNPGGGAGEGIGMGLGFGMAQQMANQQQQAQQNNNTSSTPPPIPQDNVFHIAVNGKQEGPFDLATLKSKIQSNELTKETLVWQQGMTEWKKAGEVQKLNDLFGSIPPPLPSY